MFGMYGHKVIPCSFATGSTFSTAVPILNGYNQFAISVATFAAALGVATANVYVQVANTSTTTAFQRAKYMGTYSAGSGIQDWEVPSSTGNYIAHCPALVGYAYARVELSTLTTNALSCQIHSMM